MDSISVSTILWVLFIIGSAVAAWFYINQQEKKNLINEKRRWIEILPSIISTLGVLGTFYGITDGLLGFDTSNIDASIPELLDGLKTAFFTSLAGMIGSLVLSRTTTRIYDKADKGVSDINQAAAAITASVQQMSQTLVAQTQQQSALQSAFYNNVNATLATLKQHMSTIDGNCSQTLTHSSNISTCISDMRSGITNLSANSSLIAKEVKNTAKSITNIAADIEEVDESIDALLNEESSPIYKTAESLKTTVSTLGEVANMVEGLTSGQSEISDEVKAFGDKLHNEVVDIETSMESTNKLLEKKFDEFTKLLEKSNTEALVEVMKKVTEEFNKQMSQLINKLVQENFEQLNKSVEKLNIWQQENKEMIASLTAQYKTMQEQFADTSTTLQDVGSETKELVKSNGTLHKIVDALNAVLVDDKRFVEITTNLNSASEYNKTSMAEFKAAQSALNDWVRKQRNFVEAVTQLMNKLEELNNLNNYSEKFWAETRKGMNESVGIIKSGSQSLQTQIDVIDSTFYDRLNKTLANLDACIRAMVEHYK